MFGTNNDADVESKQKLIKCLFFIFDVEIKQEQTKSEQIAQLVDKGSSLRYNNCFKIFFCVHIVLIVKVNQSETICQQLSMLGEQCVNRNFRSAFSQQYRSAKHQTSAA